MISIVPKYLSKSLLELKQAFPDNVKDILPDELEVNFRIYQKAEQEQRKIVDPIMQEFKELSADEVDAKNVDENYFWRKYGVFEGLETLFVGRWTDFDRCVGKLIFYLAGTDKINRVAYGEFWTADSAQTTPIVHGVVFTDENFGDIPKTDMDQTSNLTIYNRGQITDNVYITEYSHDSRKSIQIYDPLKLILKDNEWVFTTHDNGSTKAYYITRKIVGKEDYYDQCKIIERSKTSSFGSMQAWVSLAEGQVVPHREMRFVDETGNYGCQSDGQGIYLSIQPKVKYSGQLSQEFRYNGQGILNGFNPPTKASGYFENGVFSKGRFESPECVYDGEFKNGSQHGKGVVEYQDNNRYEGDFVEGRMEGYGTYKYPNGDVYQGQMAYNCFHGKGIMYVHTGAIYEGEFDMNAYQKGKLTVPLSSFQFGEVIANAIPMGFMAIVQGLGQCAIVLHRLLTWRILGKSPNVEVYEGAFNADGMYEGVGRHTDIFGNVYEGDFRVGERSGDGTVITPEGEKYTGEFRGGAPDGYGVYLGKKGEVYTGNFKEGEYDGYGELKEGDKVQRGIWKEGKLVEEKNERGSGGFSASTGGENSSHKTNDNQLKMAVWEPDFLLKRFLKSRGDTLTLEHKSNTYVQPHMSSFFTIRSGFRMSSQLRANVQIKPFKSLVSRHSKILLTKMIR